MCTGRNRSNVKGNGRRVVCVVAGKAELGKVAGERVWHGAGGDQVGGKVVWWQAVWRGGVNVRNGMGR